MDVTLLNEKMGLFVAGIFNPSFCIIRIYNPINKNIKKLSLIFVRLKFTLKLI
jgi:hypothetical protein